MKFFHLGGGGGEGWGGRWGNFVHSKNSFKTYDTTSPLQSLRYFVPIKRKGSKPPLQNVT